MKRTTFILALALATTTLFAQKKTTTSGKIIFDATTGKDALPKAENRTVVAAFDAKTGSIAFEAVIKNFTFSNPTIQQHFNGDKWMDSDKFPTAIFKGNLINFSAGNLKKDGTYTTDVEGELTLHGIVQPVKTRGTIIVSGKKVTATSEFNIKLADYGISGGAIAAGKVSAEPKIIVTAEMK